MKYEYTIKNDKFNRKKIFYIVIIMVVFAIIIGGLFWFINKDNIYDKYNVYDKKNKDIGTIEHYKDETENMYISLYYPKTGKCLKITGAQIQCGVNDIFVNLNKDVVDWQYHKRQKIINHTKDDRVWCIDNGKRRQMKERQDAVNDTVLF